MAAPAPAPAARAPKGDAGHELTLQERFDPNAMTSLLAHDGIDAGTKATLQSMCKSKHNGNCVFVNYAKNNKHGFGRLYAHRGRGLQVLPRDIRNALCGNLVHDIDMVNAHPVIMAHLAKQHGWVCDKLQRLCSEREQVLQEVQEAYEVDRAGAKVILLKLLYLGGLPVHHRNARALDALPCGDVDHPLSVACSPTYTYLEELRQELRTLASNMAAQYPQHAKVAERQRKAANKTTGHPLATAVSLVVSDLENRMLLAAVRELQEQGRCVTTVVYDGLHVLRLEGEADEQLPAGLLRACEASIRRSTGVDIQLAQKPMETTMQLQGAGGGPDGTTAAAQARQGPQVTWAMELSCPLTCCHATCCWQHLPTAAHIVGVHEAAACVPSGGVHLQPAQ